MAATITIVDRYVQGNRFVRTGTGNLGTYATGGIAVTKAQFGLDAALKDLQIRSAGGYIFSVTALTDAGATIIAYDQKDPAASGGADIPLPQVADTTNLASITFSWNAAGK